MTLRRWASLGAVVLGAGCLVGLYGILKQDTAAAKGNTLTAPIVVTARPVAPAESAAPVAVHWIGPVLETAEAVVPPAPGTLPAEDLGELFDDADGVEPRSMIRLDTPAPATISPASAWMRRLNVARELLRQGATETARQTLERIIGEAQVCRAYQFALVDLAAVELQRGRIESAQQLLDEARRSAQALPLDTLTAERIQVISGNLAQNREWIALSTTY